MYVNSSINTVIIETHKYVYSLVREGEISEHIVYTMGHLEKSSVEDTNT